MNKEGSIAGPKVLEHIVDCVLYFEGEPHMSYRILRSAKNRFGATNEIGVFEMADSGLTQVPNPSETLLAGRPLDTPGTCVTCVMEGVRPVLAEIQALLAPSAYGNGRRTSNGFDYNRAMLLLAVATSIDALAVGVTFAFLRVQIVPAVASIGAITFALSFAGVKIGNVFGDRFEKKAEICGGVILILIGAKILLEHLGILG